jgi:hypothetical protein
MGDHNKVTVTLEFVRIKSNKEQQIPGPGGQERKRYHKGCDFSKLRIFKDSFYLFDFFSGFFGFYKRVDLRSPITPEPKEFAKRVVRWYEISTYCWDNAIQTLFVTSCGGVEQYNLKNA